MTLKQTHPLELTAEDWHWLRCADAEDQHGLDLISVVNDAIMQKTQIWTLDQHNGVVVTQVLCHPKGKELFILALAGRGMLKQFDEVYAELIGFAHQEGCDWIGGQVARPGLLEVYKAMFGINSFRQLFSAATPRIGQDEGLKGNVLVQTPTGTRKMSALSVGDQVCGPKGNQTVVRKLAELGTWACEEGIGANKLVFRDGRWIKNSALREVKVRPGLFYEITVVPDHEFLLGSGEIVHNLGGGGGGSQTTTTKPWSGLAPYLTDLYKEAGDAFTSSQQATGGSPQQSALARQLQVAQGADAGANQTRQLALDQLSGQYLMAESNPYLQSAITAAIQPSIENYQRNIVPAIQSAAIQQGAYGGSREGIVQANAADNLLQDILNTTSQISYENYARERQNQMLSPQLLQEALNLYLQPAAIEQGVASAQQTLPFVPVNQLANILGGLPAYSATTAPGAGGTAGAFGGAASGAGLASLLGATNPWTLGLSALGGGILGGLG